MSDSSTQSESGEDKSSIGARVSHAIDKSWHVVLKTGIVLGIATMWISEGLIGCYFVRQREIVVNVDRQVRTITGNCTTHAYPIAEIPEPAVSTCLMTSSVYGANEIICGSNRDYSTPADLESALRKRASSKTLYFHVPNPNFENKICLEADKVPRAIQCNSPGSDSVGETVLNGLSHLWKFKLTLGRCSVSPKKVY